MRPLAVLLLLALAGCRAAPDAAAPPPAAPETAVDAVPAPPVPPVPSDTAWTTGEVEISGPTAPPVATLHTVRTAAHDGFDRIVFAYDGPIPGVRARYDDAPTRCGSGEPAALGTPAALAVSMQPAAAHTDAGEPTVSAPDASGLAMVQRLASTCDFEGEVAWALGVEERRPYRVFTLSDPSRIVVDVRRSTP